MSKREFIDHLGRKVEITTSPQRVVSLVPSITELLFDLGLEKQVAGITRYCVRPSRALETKKVVGGTKKQNISRIIDIHPELVIANKEENRKEDIEEIEKQFPVWVADIQTLEDNLKLISDMGEIFGREGEALRIQQSTNSIFDKIRSTNRIKVAYLIWMNPFMTVGSDTYIHQVLQKCGFENVFGDRLRYPEVSIEVLQATTFEYLFLSSEPYAFSEEERVEIQKLLPDKKVIIVDGEAFSWYGSRITHMEKYMVELIHHLHHQ